MLEFKASKPINEPIKGLTSVINELSEGDRPIHQTGDIPVPVGNGGSSLGTGVSHFTTLGLVLLAAVSIVFP